MRKYSILLVIVSLFVTVFASAPSFAQDMPSKTIAELVVDAAGAKDNPQFTILLAAVKAADPVFLEALSNKDGKFTVFAPTDDAFKALLKALNVTAEDLLKNKALLDVVLAYHVVPGIALDAKAVVGASGAVVGTLLPEHVLSISIKDNAVLIDKATVIKTDLMASNGVVHVINAVLVPADAMELAKAASDTMMATPSATEEAMGMPVSIAETVIAAASAKDQPEFTTLLAAVKAADPAVVGTLSNWGSYTVFAPTDAAFAAALKSLDLTAEKLLADKNLSNILLYHVVPGKISSGTLVKAISDKGLNVITLSGQVLTFNIKDGKVVINDGSTVVKTDIEATNGIIHVIDGVLLPPAK